MEPSIGEMFAQQIVPQLIALVGAALALLVVAVRTKAGKAIAEKMGNDAVGSALQWASNLAFELVLAAVQTEVEQLKKDLADGKVTSEEYKAQLARVKAAVMAKLSEMTMGRLLSSGAAKSVAEVSVIAGDLVESAVVKAKALEPVPVAIANP